MGLILDSSILIASERRRDTVWDVLQRVEAVCGKTTAALSAVTAAEGRRPDIWIHRLQQ